MQKKIQSGNLNRTLVFKQKVKVKNTTTNEDIITYEPTFSCKGMLNFGAGKNVFDLAQEFSSSGAEFVVRYCPVVEIRQDMIIECEGVTYDIIAPPSEIGLRQFWKIACKAKQ